MRIEIITLQENNSYHIPFLQEHISLSLYYPPFKVRIQSGHKNNKCLLARHSSWALAFIHCLFLYFCSRTFPSRLLKTGMPFHFFKVTSSLMLTGFGIISCHWCNLNLCKLNNMKFLLKQKNKIKIVLSLLWFNSWIFPLVNRKFHQYSRIILNPLNLKGFRRQFWEMYWWKWVYFWHRLSPVLNSAMVQGIFCISAYTGI